jgi:hypothetical protein
MELPTIVAILVALVGAMIVLCSPPVVRALGKAMSVPMPPASPAGFILGTRTLPCQCQALCEAGTVGVGRHVRVVSRSSTTAAFVTKHMWAGADAGLPIIRTAHGAVAVSGGFATVTVYVGLAPILVVGAFFAGGAVLTLADAVRNPDIGRWITATFWMLFAAFAYRSLHRGVSALAEDAVGTLGTMGTLAEPQSLE